MANTCELKQVTIVGGGPVGALQACYLSKHGYQVDLYEGREDIRKIENASGRSINLALSYRGIEALKRVGLHKQVVALGMPMHGRMIHLPNGKSYAIPYGKQGQYLLSVDRMQLNRDLLTAAGSLSNVRLHFDHKLTSCNIREASTTFTNKGKNVEAKSLAIFGCDGAHSVVRQQLQRGVFDYEQHYISHGYKELTIPPTADDEFAMSPEHLHIWPRHEYMLIALPNQDRSFTCTLFMPFDIFNKLTEADDVVKFFQQEFPSSLPLIGESLLKTDFFLLPPLPLVSIKTSRYNYKDRVALLGDAAHACVPFYGQGLNAGLEDVLVFDEVMTKENCDFEKVFPSYSDQRTADGRAVVELSHQNYIEMRSSVASNWFLFRKKVDSFLNYLLPRVIIPKYEMVAFTRLPYHECIERAERQNKAINWALAVTGMGLVAATSVVVWKLHKGDYQIPESFFRFCENMKVVVL